MTKRVAVAGASGYAGGELLRLIAGHPLLQLELVTAESSAGKTVGEVHRNLVGCSSGWASAGDSAGSGGSGGSAGLGGLGGLRFEPHEAIKQADCDLVFLALPSGQSAPLAVGLADEVKVVDLGPDFRLADADAWARHYGGMHAGRWVTGLA